MRSASARSAGRWHPALAPGETYDRWKASILPRLPRRISEIPVNSSLAFMCQRFSAAAISAMVVYVPFSSISRQRNALGGEKSLDLAIEDNEICLFRSRTDIR